MYVGEGLTNPRQIRTAPNGDYFVADTGGGAVRVFRGITADGEPEQSSVFATLPAAFGINFYPPGPNPQWVYVTNTSTLVRFPYKNGDLKATGAAQTLISGIPAGGGHSTRDIIFSKDGKSLFLAVGSASNNNDDEKEFHRSNILEYTPEGKFVGIYASGIRNPVGLAINPETGELWTSINERDTYGDNLVPDYVTHVERGGVYGWPWSRAAIACARPATTRSCCSSRIAPRLRRTRKQMRRATHCLPEPASSQTSFRIYRYLPRVRAAT
jgi:glucose/arabinose dehydrogenase